MPRPILPNIFSYGKRTPINPTKIGASSALMPWSGFLWDQAEPVRLPEQNEGKVRINYHRSSSTIRAKPFIVAISRGVRPNPSTLAAGQYPTAGRSTHKSRLVYEDIIELN